MWLLVLSIATPVAGQVGFSIQLRQVRKAKLENEKLLLEISALRNAAESRERIIQLVTTDEVLRYGRDEVMFSRTQGPNLGLDNGSPISQSSTMVRFLLTAAVLGLSILVLVYVLFDLYRFVRWIADMF